MKTATAVAVAAAMCLSPAETEAANHASAITGLVWGGGSSGVCGAYNPTNDPTATAVGPCGAKVTDTPDVYTWQRAWKTALLTDDKTYLTAPNDKTGDAGQNVQLLSVSGDNKFANWESVTFPSDDKTNPGAKYNYVMSGGLFGDATMGAYLGVASYLNTGDKEIKTKTNTVRVASFTNKAKQNSGGSTNGAPMGPYATCITTASATTENKCDGPDRTFGPGAYKFSIFGYTMGSAYKVPTLGGKAAKYIGVRMQMGVKVDTTKLSGSYDFKLNKGTKTLATIGTDDVTDMTLTYCPKTGDCKSQVITFPNKYNTGSVAGAKDDGKTVMPVAATKTIKIKASPIMDKDGKPVPDEMYLDYLMEVPTAADTYLMYDPDVTAKTVKKEDVPASAGGTKKAASADSASGSAGFVSAQTSAVASVVAAVAAFFMI